MSNETQTDAAAVVAVEASEPVSREEMTLEKYQQWEREVQLGIRDTLPTGEKISDFRDGLIEKQLEQEKTLRESAIGENANISTEGVLGVVAPETLVEVTVHANGAVSATPVIEKVEPLKSDGDGEPDNDLPDNFPHRDKLLAAGHTSLETVAKMTLDDLKGVDGIGGKTAQAILDYGQSA